MKGEEPDRNLAGI